MKFSKRLLREKSRLTVLNRKKKKKSPAGTQILRELREFLRKMPVSRRIPFVDNAPIYAGILHFRGNTVTWVKINRNFGENRYLVYAG